MRWWAEGAESFLAIMAEIWRRVFNRRGGLTVVSSANLTVFSVWIRAAFTFDASTSLMNSPRRMSGG